MSTTDPLPMNYRSDRNGFGCVPSHSVRVVNNRFLSLGLESSLIVSVRRRKFEIVTARCGCNTRRGGHPVAKPTYGSAPEGWEKHDKLLVETQIDLLEKITDIKTPLGAPAFAEAYALVSGNTPTQRVEVNK